MDARYIAAWLTSYILES